MASPSGLRKLGLAGALAGTLYAVFTPNDGQTYQTAPLPVAEPAPLLGPVAPAGAVFVEEDGDEEGGDPFAQRNWVPPAPPESAKPAAAVAAVPAAPAPPPGPPTLPFQFAGRMNDGNEQVIYLARGDQALIARPGEVLENTYKVVSIEASQIEFEHIPTGQKQVLPIPGREN